MRREQREASLQPEQKQLKLLRAVVFLWALLLFTAALRPMTLRAEQAYGYLLPDSSYSYIDAGRVAGWPAQVINYAKNEIYARNGRQFVSAELQNWFNAQYWYTPIYTPDQFSDGMLNPYETANVAMLSQREDQLGTYQLDAPGYNYSLVYQYLGSGSAGGSAYGPYYVDPDTYIFYDSSIRYLSDADISGLSLQELCFARNEIYARHGYIFVSAELSDYFNAKNWYWGTADSSTFSDAVFNSFETANISLLLNREQSLAPGGYVLDQAGYTYQLIGSYSSGSAVQTTSASYLFYDSAVRYLTDAEVSGLSLQQMCYARNEIYARRGYIFQSQELRDYFGSKSWYYPTVPAAYFSDQVFNAYEMANIGLLKSWEYSIDPNGYTLY